LYQNNFIDGCKDEYASVNDSASWYFKHSSHSIVSSDVLTKNLYLLDFCDNTHKYNNRQEYESFEYLSSKDLLFLMQRSASMKISKKYYIINYKLKSNYLDNWIVINSWSPYKNQLEQNRAINNIYETNFISIFY
jgi:hypothetical protein